MAGTESGPTRPDTDDGVPLEAIAPEDPVTEGHDRARPAYGQALKSTLREFSEDGCTDLAAALTYYSVMASAPAILALVSLLGFVGDAEAALDSITTALEEFLPQETLDIITPLIDNALTSTGAGFALIAGLVLALWSASGYVGAFGRAMNVVYEVAEGRPVWKLRPVMYAITLAVVLLAVVIVASLVLSGPIVSAVGDAVGLSAAALTVWNIAKWPVALLLVVFVVALLYHFTPNVKHPRFRWTSLGSAVAIGIWILASAGFAFYVTSFSYGSTYGTLGTVIVFLLWLWITNLALLLGAELDSEIERSRELRDGYEAEVTLQLPPRDTRASDKKAAKKAESVAEAREVRQAATADQDVAATRTDSASSTSSPTAD
ncbi:membrane protein [Isoptericola jiangsuensis]|uniref:Membrane protein n=1 Tax=Isoptericola jiangsuensis TaxID=548579 RepID=A0A2A9F287_9MICO|nr:YihY/virulence factor BrkB family protein [Isoptericola jiangsuensis]PFG44652.1 membrane protein [Isoptericola jiangsuensis]